MGEGRDELRPTARWGVALLSLLAVLALPPAVLAADPVSVQADGFSFWDGTRLFVASGNVVVRWADAVISADTVRYDDETGIIVFEGRVVYVEGDQELAGARLQVNFHTGEAVMDDLDAVMHAQGVDGPMFVRGQRVESSPGLVRIQGGRLTTCACEDNRPPAYHFAAREIEIYPGERLVVRGVTFHEHGVPLLYLPYMTLSLKEGSNHFDFPQIGYSTRTGWFVKTTYNYVLESGLYGAILLDYFQYLGFGAGVRHTYRHDDTGRGTVLVYGVGNRSGGLDGTLEWEREWTLERWRMTTGIGYDFSTAPGGLEREEVRARLRLEQTSGEGSARGELEYKIVAGAEPLEHLKGHAELRRPLGDGWNLHLRVEGYEHETLTTLRRWLGYGAEVRRTTPNYTLAVRLEQQVHPDLKDEDKSPVVPWTHVSRLPEITWETRAITGLHLSAGLARLKEEPDGTEAWRGEARAAVSTRSWRVGDGAVLTASGSLLGRTYSTGRQQLSLETRTGFNWQLAQPLGLTLQHTYRQAWGSTPFLFDNVTNASTLSARLHWRSPSLTASLNGSYNLLTRRWNPITLNTTFRVTPELSLRGAASFDLLTGSWQNLVATMDWRPAEGWLVRLGGQYNVPMGELQRVDAQLEMALSGGWKAGVTAIYNVTHNTFSRSEVFFAHDAECREIRLSYDHKQGEVWLEYQIAAFPSSRVAVGAAQDKLMFESDALSDLLGI